MGNLIQALKMIMEGLGDVSHAIEFCKEQNDEELWENLITYSMDKPRESLLILSPPAVKTRCLSQCQAL
jgi:hypothetical protein